MSSKKRQGGGGRVYSTAAPSMRRGGGGGGSRGGGRGGKAGRGRTTTGMAAQAAVHGEGGAPARRVRASRAQHAFGLDADDWDGESKQHQAQRYESDPALGSREYVLPDNFEDEQLDSDDEGVFNSDDESKYGDIFAKRKQPAAAKGKAKGGKKGVRSTASTEEDEYEVDGDVSEEEEDISGFEGAPTMSLSDMIGMDDGPAGAEEEEEEEERARPSKKQKKPAGGATKLTRKQLQAMEEAEAEEEAAAAAAEMDDEDDDEEEEMDEEYDEDEADDDDADAHMSPDDDDEDAGVGAGGDAHKSLLRFVEGLGSADDAAGKDGKSRRGASARRGLVERNEAFEEGQFAIPKHAAGADGAPAVGGGLKLSDLLKKLPSSSSGEQVGDSSAVSALKKQFSVLHQSAHTRTLAEPLPEVRREELLRATTYAAVKEEVARWTPLINRHRDAASLTFPMHGPQRQNLSSAELQTRFQPAPAAPDATADHSLESDLAALLSDYGLKESSLMASETAELAAHPLTPAERAKREEGVAKMKALLFYQEQKLARMHRIKSKTYRRLKKKQREKGRLSVQEMKELEPLAYEAEQRKLEQRRIEERMSLSHSNSSKWMAKQLRLNNQQRNANADVRDSIAENDRLRQEIRQKQEAFPKEKDSDGEDISDDSEEEEQDMDESEEEVDEDGQPRRSKQEESRAASLRAKLAELESSLGGAEDDEPAVGFDVLPGSKSKSAGGKSDKESRGLLGLKFMQRAAEVKRAETLAAIKAYQAELEQEERREEVRRANRREGKEEMDDEELDVQIASSMPPSAESAAANAAAVERAGRKRIDANSGRGALAAAVPADQVKLLQNSLQSAATGRSKGSKTRVDGPISVPLPAGVGAAKKAAEARQAEHLHPGQHHTVHGKSSVSVDTPFIPASTAEALFPLEEFSDDEQGANGTRAAGATVGGVDLDKIKHDVRASMQRARKAAGQAKDVRMGAMEDDEEQDRDLDAQAGAEEAAPANPWAQASVSNPRKAARQAAKAAKKAGAAKSGATTGNASSSSVMAGGDDDDDDDEEDGAGAGAIDMELSGSVSLRSKRGAGASEFDLLAGGNLSQAELVRRAFSSQGDGEDGPGVAAGARAGPESAEQEFARLKAEVMEEDLPKEEMPVTGLPGWGSWGGLGATNFKSPAVLKREAAEKARRDARRAHANSARADAKLRHVILNEKVDAKALKYQVAALPYPFTSVAQYELSLQQPVGKEWNTSASFQANVKPKIITRPGEIIEPAKYNPKVGAKGRKAAKQKEKQQATTISGAKAAAGQKRKR